MSSEVLTVSQLTRVVRDLLELEIGQVWVEGEVSNHRRQASGHHYFSLKDAKSQLSCVLFRGAAGAIPGLRLEDGMQVQVAGGLTVYEARGQYQLIVRIVQSKGVGLLQAKFEALKKMLQAEGLFEPGRKRELPRFPRAIGLVTSPTGAAVRDMINVLRRRAPWVDLMLHPVKVQGEGAAEEIAGAVADLNRWSGRQIPRLDLLIVGRGGGSIEDLWAFNEEVVARAIAGSELPIVSAVGHEIDFTIADFVADLRAPTPSAAAELVVPDKSDLLAMLRKQSALLRLRVMHALEAARQLLDRYSEQALRREPARCLENASQRVDLASAALDRAARDAMLDMQARVTNLGLLLRQFRPDEMLQRQRHMLELLSHRMGEKLRFEMQQWHSRTKDASGLLRLLGPMHTLERGYSVTLEEDGRLVTSAAGMAKGKRIVTRLADGSIRSVVEDSAVEDGDRQRAAINT